MGYYIETPENHGKAKQIAAMPAAKAEILTGPPSCYKDIPEGRALIVVVDNRIFEAAAFCYEESEFLVFTDPRDFRPRDYVLVDRDWAEIQSGFRR